MLELNIKIQIIIIIIQTEKSVFYQKLIVNSID